MPKQKEKKSSRFSYQLDPVVHQVLILQVCLAVLLVPLAQQILLVPVGQDLQVPRMIPVYLPLLWVLVGPKGMYNISNQPLAV